MEIEKYYGVIKKFRDAQIYQHLYTNGILATEETLKALGEAGLNEIRFNLGAAKCSDKVIENIKIAKKYNTTWQELYIINKDIIGSNPNLIKVGQVLKIKESLWKK